VPHERADDKSPASHQPNALVVPLQRAGNLFLVTVHLVGEAGETDARLIVDTGASHTIVSHKLALALSLYSDSALGTVTMNTVGGPVQAPLSRLKSIQLKEAEVTNSLVVIHDLPDSPDGAEGLLGLSVLQHFQVTLDPGRSVLSLQPFPK
jgi:predicted aspartyl protease